MPEQTPAQKPLRSFGRRNGRLRRNPERLLNELLPQFALSPSLPLPSGYERLALEIGFGAGEHMAAQARAHPRTLYIGCEPYMPGVAKLLRRIEDEDIRNIRLFTDDARDLMAHLPAGSVHEAYILFPDPWPKLRHHKRRLITPEFLAALARLQPVGAPLLIATDHPDYAAWILNAIHDVALYSWQAERESDWLSLPASWAETKYQRKTSAQGRPPMFFHCLREKA